MQYSYLFTNLVCAAVPLALPHAGDLSRDHCLQPSALLCASCGLGGEQGARPGRQGARTKLFFYHWVLNMYERTHVTVHGLWQDAFPGREDVYREVGPRTPAHYILRLFSHIT